MNEIKLIKFKELQHLNSFVLIISQVPQYIKMVIYIFLELFCLFIVVI